MVIMDGVRRMGGLLWVGFGLVFQVLSFRGTGVLPGPATLLLCGVVVLLTLLTLTRSGRATWLVGWAAAVLIGLDFGGAVADRFGALGPPGSGGVSWGGWGPFVNYTARLLPGADRGLVTVAAAAATVVEVTLAVLLLTGWRRRWVGKAAAGLLLVYLVSMVWALGSDAAAAYGLPVLIGGALLVSSCPVRRPADGPRAQPHSLSRLRAGRVA